MSFRLVYSAAFCLLLTSFLYPDTMIVNPSIPAEEHIVYLETIGSKQSLISDELRIRSLDGKVWIEVREVTDNGESLYRLDPSTLMPFHIETTTRDGMAVIKRSTDIVPTGRVEPSDHLFVADFGALSYILRGFPWEIGRTARIDLPGGGRGYGLSFSVLGKETILAEGKSYECWKAELGMEGVIGAIAPKSRFWFLASPPHYLVRYEGPSGMPGSPPRTVELRSYSAVIAAD